MYLLISAQTINLDNKPLIEDIMSKPDIYYFGFAEGKQRKETNQQALQQLIQNLSLVNAIHLVIS